MQWNIEKSFKTVPLEQEMNFFPPNFDVMFIDKMAECSKYMFIHTVSCVLCT